jgi:catechol 2,3-dioxygenase-like lactoylglutathione lyase family enzyme
VHPVLASSDVETSIAFFGRLGFTLRFKDVPAGPKYAAVRRDEVELHIQWATPDQWVDGLDRPVFRFLVADVDALFEEFLKAGGIDADTGHRSPWAKPADTPWGTREFHVRDPAGNGLQFYRPLAGQKAVPGAGGHRWYSRPVLFVADLNRALHFYIDQLGFRKDWHADDGAGTVCQVSRSDCEIILCQDNARRDKTRLFIELTAEGLRDFRRELADRSVPNKATRWGYDTTQVDDPDGNELFFPEPG